MGMLCPGSRSEFRAAAQLVAADDLMGTPPLNTNPRLRPVALL